MAVFASLPRITTLRFSGFLLIHQNLCGSPQENFYFSCRTKPSTLCTIRRKCIKQNHRNKVHIFEILSFIDSREMIFFQERKKKKTNDSSLVCAALSVSARLR